MLGVAVVGSRGHPISRRLSTPTLPPASFAAPVPISRITRSHLHPLTPFTLTPSLLQPPTKSFFRNPRSHLPTLTTAQSPTDGTGGGVPKVR